MTDLTPTFKKYVDIVQHEIGHSIEKDQNQNKTRQLQHQKRVHERFTINDTFIKETKELYSHLVVLSEFLVSIKSTYLSTNDDYSNHLRSNRSLTLNDKNKVDEEFKFKIHELYEKLKLLQTYEKKRQEAVESNKSKSLFNGIFGGADFDDDELFLTTIGIHRTLILKLLNEVANSVNKKFESMQRKRYEREKQLNLLNFQNLEDDLDLNYSNDVPPSFENSYNEIELQEQDSSFSGLQELSQQQIQELDSENQEFLALKTNQLKQVEKLHNSMIDIVSLQAELTYQLETQSDQITNLLDNQSQVEVDLKMGNQNLNKATTRNKKGANLIILTCFILGFLLLFVDYISF